MPAKQKHKQMPVLDFERICRDYGIPTAPGRHKHRRRGWEQVECINCTGNKGYHLGYEYRRARFVCWRCGWMSYTDALTRLLKIPVGRVDAIIKKYATSQVADTTPVFDPADSCMLPEGCKEMTDRHKGYLSKRRYDPDKLEQDWGLMGTGRLGEYKFRIIAPIFLDRQLVTFQGRDITDKAPTRYKACNMENEKVHHKHTLYGLDQARGRSSVIVVEGIADAWRLGYGAVATFGIAYTAKQVLALKEFHTRYIMFDPGDAEAIASADRLMFDLDAFPGHTEVIQLGGRTDPGDLSQRDANQLKKDLIG